MSKLFVKYGGSLKTVTVKENSVLLVEVTLSVMYPTIVNMPNSLMGSFGLNV